MSDLLVGMQSETSVNSSVYSDVYIHPQKICSLISSALQGLPEDCFQNPAIDTAVIEYVLPSPPPLLSSMGWVLRQEYRNIRSVYYNTNNTNNPCVPTNPLINTKICMTGSMIGRENASNTAVGMILDENCTLPRRMVDTILASSNVPCNITPPGMQQDSSDCRARFSFNPTQNSGSSICAFSAQSEADVKGLELGSAPETFLLSCTCQYNLVHGLTNVRAYLEYPSPVPVQYPQMMQSVHHLRVFKKSDNQGFEIENQENSVNWTRTDASVNALQMQMPTDLWIVRIRAKTSNHAWKEDLFRMGMRLSACIADIQDVGGNQYASATKKRRLNEIDGA